MSFAGEFSLRPELVHDVVEELLEADIISPNQIRSLKNENWTLNYDPNLLMDIRHEQVKIRSFVTPKEKRSNENRITEKIARKVQIDQIEVNKEIEKFKKELELERKKLIQLNKISHHEKKSVINNKQNTIVDQPIPVTNIVTQLKNKDNDKDISSLPMNEMEKCNPETKKKLKHLKQKPIEVNGYKPLSITTQSNKRRCLNEQSLACPHRLLNEEHTEVKCQSVEEKSDSTIPGKKVVNNNLIKSNHTENKKRKTNFLASKTIDKWKLFVIQQQTTRCKRYDESLRIKQRKYLLKKYWNKWLDYCKTEKKIRDEIIKKKSRMEKLNLFFEKIQVAKNELVQVQESIPYVINQQSQIVKELNDKKNKSCIIDKNAVFFNRLKAQKSIIQEQKAKLAEQNKLIEHLKEEKLTESINEFNKNLLFNVRESVQNCDKILKPNLKLLANKFNIYNDNTEKLKDNYFVIKMNERAQERKEKWEMIRMRKQLQEEEKNRKQIEEEERKQDEEKKEKRKKIQEKKEEIRLQKENEMKKLHETEEMKRKMEVAREHFENHLKRKFIKILKTNVESQQRYGEQLEIYYKRKLMKEVLMVWKEKSQASAKQNLEAAVSFHETKLIYSCLESWIMFYSDSIKKYQVAEDFYDAKLIEKMFNCWKVFTEEQNVEEDRKTGIANSHYHRKLMKKFFKKWKLFPNFIRKKREEEKRIRSWREKVLEVIPDFNPQLLYDDDDDDNKKIYDKPCI